MDAGLTIIGAKPLSTDRYYRDAVQNLESKILEEFGDAAKDGNAVAPVNNYICKGNYAREIFINAGTCMIGKIHKHEHINVLSKGRCLVVTEDGREELEAPLTWISKAGIKRAVYAYTDVIWTTVHPTNETDLDKIEDEVIAKDYDDLNLFLEYVE